MDNIVSKYILFSNYFIMAVLSTISRHLNIMKFPKEKRVHLYKQPREKS